MKEYLISALLLCAAPILTAQEFVRGADLSWVTEMEADGQAFYDAEGAAAPTYIDLLGRPTTTPHPGNIYILLQPTSRHLIRY